MGIERTDIANQAFAGATEAFLAERRELFHQTVIGQIEGSEEYPVDDIWQEDYMLEQLGRLAMPNVDDRKDPVITDEEASAIYIGWILKRRPDIAVIRVTPKPRGYGRGYLNE